MIGADASSRDEHHMGFLENALDSEREQRELAPPLARTSQRGAAPVVTKGGYTQLTDEHEPARAAALTPQPQPQPPL